MYMEDRTVRLQLWDTAGQVKKSYFFDIKQTNLCSKQYDGAKQTHSLGAISQPDS